MDYSIPIFQLNIIAKSIKKNTVIEYLFTDNYS